MIRCGYFPNLAEVMQEQYENWLEYAWAMDSEDVWVIDCARCGRSVEVDDPENRERDAFCDECADECLPYPETPELYMGRE